MTKKNTTTSTTPSTINTTTSVNEKKEGITMSKKNTTATTSTMTASEFKQASYDAYLSYVAFIEGKQDSATTVEALSPLMSKYGFTLTVDNLANLLTVKMTAFGKDKGEQAKKVKSISTFRAFVKGGWQDVSAAPVHFSAGKNPADVKPSKSKNTITKAQLAEQNAALMAELAALRAAQSANTTTEAATTEQVAA
ncbi:MAG: hypothetical protein IJ089_01455 [Clostridia bacterium]|nr:hypothetical protein [Clostridia bacterium]